MKNDLRLCVGPRGGRHELSTPCASCVAYASCRPGRVTEPWGCDSWVDDLGRRPVLEAPAWMKHAAEVAEIASFEEIDRLDVEPAEAEPSFIGVAGFDPEGSGPVLVAYVDPPAPFEPEALGEGQGVLPMPDAGPLFAGPKRGRS